MGVDYTANYGIGVKLIELTDEELAAIHEDYYSMSDYLDDLPKPEGIGVSWFGVGNNYVVGDDEWFLVIDEPFEDGIDGLKHKVAIFKKWLDDNQIKYEPAVSIVDQVGGLLIH